MSACVTQDGSRAASPAPPAPQHGLSVAEMLAARKLLGVVVGSADPVQHQHSLEQVHHLHSSSIFGNHKKRMVVLQLSVLLQGTLVAEMVEDLGKFDTCLVEVNSKGPWMLHREGDKASIDKEKFTSVVKKKRLRPEVKMDFTCDYIIQFCAGRIDTDGGPAGGEW